MAKTIGILGGMGSFATNDFVGKLLKLSEPDEFLILVDYAVHIPSRTRAVKYGETDPWDAMSLAMQNLYEWGADIVAVPCNSAHYWYKQARCKTWLNMIEITANAVKDAGYSKPLILGGYVTVEKKLYSEYLPGAVYPSKKKLCQIEQVIQWLKNNESGKHSVYSPIRYAINSERRRVDSILLACTELSFMWREDIGREYCKKELPIIDSSHEYAKAVVEEARK